MRQKTAEISKTGETVKTLRLWEMIFLGKGTLVRQLIHGFISIALRLFFRRIEAANIENVPKNGAVLFVLNHPNGLVDPGLVFVSLPRRVSFLAKSTLFDIPVGGFLLRTFEILPVYRRVDAAGDMTKNQQTFRNCYELLAQGRCIAIFPEGISHNETKLQPMKTGAARIALGALGYDLEEKRREGKVEKTTETQSLKTGDSSPDTGKNDAFNLKIMPVGLYYTSKTAFRSEALIRYGEAFDVEPVELDENGEPPREKVLRLTAKIETALRDITLNLETEKELETVVKAEALFSSVYENLIFKKTLTQSFQRLQDLAGKYKLLGENEPEKMRQLGEKVTEYENKLKNSGLTVESLSVLDHPTAYVFRYLILRLLVLILLAPFAIVGAIIHSPAYLISSVIGLMFKTHGTDEAGSTYKILAACVFMPLTWIVAAGIVFYFYGWQFALLSLPLTIFCGYIALRSTETLIDMSVWLKSAWLLFSRRALFLRLLVQRKTLQKEIGEFIEE
ncbi:MAG: 1-acyl-sn-glycerol-3-phosphate acyltransferase [Acidobacteria bacterium]|nr:1-acyl-sn-glycerol-3-phosphate acyltransferase [Acidobacteriota bacterium]